MAFTEIDKPSDYFNTVLYTGNGSTQSISGVNFTPDWVWIKNRVNTTDHLLFDVVRNAPNFIKSNSTSAEVTGLTSVLTSFDTDGFTVGNDGGINSNGDTYASWNWLASNTTASNTDGSITSTVSANTTSGFSIVSWTGDGTSTATIGHSLGVIPSMIILKNRTDVTNWVVKHKSLSSGYNLFLNDSSAQYNTTGQGHLADLSSSSTFGFVAGSSGNNQSNGSGDNMIAYCFAEKKGFSKAFSYTGNGSSDSPFIYFGFKPAFVMLKRTDSTGDWQIQDSKRPEYNPLPYYLEANNSNAEVDWTSSFPLDFVSNGMKIRNSGTQMNASGGSYIGIAFAENPIVGSNGVPSCAR